MSRKIVVAVKPMQDIRFNGIGDYFVDAEGAVHIEVGDTGSDASNLLILIHETTSPPKQKRTPPRPRETRRLRHSSRKP